MEGASTAAEVSACCVGSKIRIGPVASPHHTAEIEDSGARLRERK